MFAHITLQIAWKGALFSKKHVELILITPFQAYLTDDSSNAVFTIKITFRLCRSIVIMDLSTVMSALQLHQITLY